MGKPKFFITTTIGLTFIFFRGQPRLWKEMYDVCAISSGEDDLKAFCEAEGIRYKYMPLHREISFWSDVACLFRYLWLFIRERPYVVHGNTPKASMLSMTAAWLTRRPVRVYMCHGLRYQSAEGGMQRLLMWFEKLSCACATEVLCVSQGVRKQLVADGLCAAHKAKVVGYGTAGGVDTGHFSRQAQFPAAGLNLPEGAFVFTFVGRIVRDKGIGELVAAFRRLYECHPDVYLLLVGDKEQTLSPLDPSTLETMQENSHIIQSGFQKDIRPFLAMSDAFVLPSYREGVGQVLLEAGCMDVPCIATDIIGCNEVIIPGVNGDLVPSHDEEALYLKMKEWAEHPEYLRKMAASCRESIVSRFARERVWQAYWTEYRNAACGLIKRKEEKGKRNHV